MDLSIDAYNRLISKYKTNSDTAKKVNQIFSQGKAAFSDPEYEVIVAGFMQNQAIEGLFERIQLDRLGLKVMPADQGQLAIALLTKAGYDIVATDKDLAGEVMDVIARKPGSDDVAVIKCGPATVRKLIGYLERPNTSILILDPQYRLFTFRRGPNWDSFMDFHKDVQEGTAPESRPVQPEEPTPADVIKQHEEKKSSEDASTPPVDPDSGIDVPGASSEEPEVPDENPDETEEEEEKARRGPVFTIGDRKLPRILTKEQVAGMIRISGPVQRDNLLLQCMYFLGMSNAEVQNLKLEDINFSAGKVKISQGKNRRDRTLPVPEELLGSLRAFAGARTDGYLIRGRDRKGKRISDRHIRRIVKAYAKEAGVPNWEDIHPHTLRHSYATHLLDEGTPIESVQNILGHERLETTAIYSHIRSTRQLQDHVTGALSG